MWLDLRHALRNLGRSPGVSLLIVATLMLGIGASTAMFSLVDTVLLRPLPYAEPDRLVSLDVRGPLADWQTRSVSFEQLASVARVGYPVFLTSDERPALLRTARVSENFFEVLGVELLLGCAPASRPEGQPSSEVAISHGLWERRYGADPGVLGQRMGFEGGEAGTVIVGVVPAGFEYPARTDAWLPAFPGLPPRLGRLANGVSVDQAATEVTVIASQLSRDLALDGPAPALVAPPSSSACGRLSGTAGHAAWRRRLSAAGGVCQRR